MLKRARIAVFVSGGGTNLEALLKAQEAGAIPHGEIVLVCASNETAYALARAATTAFDGQLVVLDELISPRAAGKIPPSGPPPCQCTSTGAC